MLGFGIFQTCLAVTSSPRTSGRGLIVELPDGCNIRCPTCIAGSAPGLDNLRSPERVARHIAGVNRESKLAALFLSGGEPTIHPNLPDFMEAVERCEVKHRILVTNGVRIARERKYAFELFSPQPKEWEVFLQFDSLRRDALVNIRGSDLRAVRLNALHFSESEKIATTLVCVVRII